MKLLNLLLEQEKILIPRRSAEERQKNHIIATQKKIQQYIKNGSKGFLDLEHAPITSLPDNLTYVGGDLNLRGTPISSLPDNLEVRGTLDLINTPITSLPDNLKVGAHLYLARTKITSLPSGLKVGGELYLWSTPLSEKYTEEEIRKMAPGVEGNISI